MIQVHFRVIVGCLSQAAISPKVQYVLTTPTIESNQTESELEVALVSCSLRLLQICF